MVNNGKNIPFDEIKLKLPLKRYLRQKHEKKLKLIKNPAKL